LQDSSIVPKEPFCLGEVTGEPYLYISPLDDATNLNIAIFKNVVHKMDNKYLDLDWLPTVEEAVILEEQTVENGRLDAVDTKFLVQDTPVTVYINGIPWDSKIQYISGDGWYVIIEDVRVSSEVFGRVSFLLNEGTTLVLSDRMADQKVKICLKVPNKIPEYYLPDSLPGGNVDLTGIVKSVNGEKPDAEGNVNLTIPQGGDACYVMVTEFFDGTVQADKTNAELWQAFNENKAIHCVFMSLDSVGNMTTDPVVLGLISGSETYAHFIKTICAEGLALTWVVDIRDDVASVTKLTTPMVVSVNGQTPDENGNVEITIPGSGGNVAYDEAQDLTEEQKSQARENIGAQPAGNYLTEVPEGYAKTEDIPTDEHINGLIDAKLAAMPNAAEVAY
jgi:hypothetical protein